MLLRVQSGRLHVSDACVLIGLQRRQVFRLLRGLKQNGVTSLLSKRRGKLSNHRLPAEVRALALSIVAGAVLRLWSELGGGEAGRASRLFGVARDVARLDDRRWAMAGPSASSCLAASAAPLARLPRRPGARSTARSTLGLRIAARRARCWLLWMMRRAG